MLLREERDGVGLEIEKLGDVCDIPDCGSNWCWEIIDMGSDRITLFVNHNSTQCVKGDEQISQIKEK